MTKNNVIFGLIFLLNSLISVGQQHIAIESPMFRIDETEIELITVHFEFVDSVRFDTVIEPGISGLLLRENNALKDSIRFDTNFYAINDDILEIDGIKYNLNDTIQICFNGKILNRMIDASNPMWRGYSAKDSCNYFYVMQTLSQWKEGHWFNINPGIRCNIYFDTNARIQKVTFGDKYNPSQLRNYTGIYKFVMSTDGDWTYSVDHNEKYGVVRTFYFR